MIKNKEKERLEAMPEAAKGAMEDEEEEDETTETEEQQQEAPVEREMPGELPEIALRLIRKEGNFTTMETALSVKAHSISEALGGFEYLKEYVKEREKKKL